MAEFSELQGKTLKAVEQRGDDVLRFTDEDGRVYELYHSQDCCESVTIESITGELADLIGTPILAAEEVTSEVTPTDVKNKPDHYEADSQTWTFYKLRTIKGSVDIRWYGASNGYYSESVDFREVTE